MTRIRLTVPLALLALALVAGCGGEDPEQVLEETFSNDQTATSGVIDVTLEASAEGGAAASGTLTLSGPFQAGEDAETLPELDITATADASALGQDFSFDGGLVLTADNGYVEYQGQAYEVGADTFRQIQELLQTVAAQAPEGEEAGSPSEAIQQSCETAAEQTGGDPAACDVDFGSWVDNLEDEGTVDVDGTPTTQITGDLNIEQMVSDFGSITQAIGGGVGPVPGSEQFEQIGDAITEASFDVYSGEEDRILLGLDFNLGVDATAIPGAELIGLEGISLSFALRINDVNQPQTIEAPANAKPIDQLLKELGIDDDLGFLFGGGIPGIPGGGLPLQPGTEIPGLPTTPTG